MPTYSFTDCLTIAIFTLSLYGGTKVLKSKTVLINSSIKRKIIAITHHSTNQPEIAAKHLSTKTVFKYNSKVNLAKGK